MFILQILIVLGILSFHGANLFYLCLSLIGIENIGMLITGHNWVKKADHPTMSDSKILTKLRGSPYFEVLSFPNPAYRISSILKKKRQILLSFYPWYFSFLVFQNWSDNDLSFPHPNDSYDLMPWLYSFIKYDNNLRW